MMQAVNVLSGDGGGASGRCGERVQQCWLFEHPRRDLVLNAQGEPDSYLSWWASNRAVADEH